MGRTASHPDGAVGVVCAYNEEDHIAKVVDTVRSVPEIEQVLVIDGGSEDRTWERAEAAGADVVLQDDPSYPAKGDAVATALRLTRQQVLVYVDGDWDNLEAESVRSLAMPLLEDQADRTHATFERSARRVTELTARPLLRRYFPEIRVRQPLAGEYGMKRSMLRRMRIERDWGVEAGLLIDHTMLGARTMNVDFGYKSHPMKELKELRDMADHVARTILDRAKRYGRLVEPVGAADKRAEVRERREDEAEVAAY